MKIRVTNVRFHQSVHVGGIGEIGTVLPSGTKSIPELVMYIGEGGHLVCTSAKGNFMVGASNLIGGSIVIEFDGPESSPLKVVPKAAKAS